MWIIFVLYDLLDIKRFVFFKIWIILLEIMLRIDVNVVFSGYWVFVIWLVFIKIIIEWMDE